MALVSLPLAAVAGPPYLGSERVNPWLVVFAIALFGALFASVFLVERLQRARRPGGEQRWEPALLVWGALALGVLALALAIGLAGDLSGDSLAGSAGLVAAAEALLVLGTLLVWILSG